jgi:hypothetical protein
MYLLAGASCWVHYRRRGWVAQTQATLLCHSKEWWGKCSLTRFGLGCVDYLSKQLVLYFGLSLLFIYNPNQMLNQIVSEKRNVRVSAKMLEMMFRELLKNNKDGESIMALAFAALIETSPDAFEVLQEMAEGSWEPPVEIDNVFLMRLNTYGEPDARHMVERKIVKIHPFRRTVTVKALKKGNENEVSYKDLEVLISEGQDWLANQEARKQGYEAMEKKAKDACDDPLS